MISTLFTKDKACITVSAKSSFFFDFSNMGNQCALVGPLRIKASHLSMETFFLLLYCALPGPATSGILCLASYKIVSALGNFMIKYA